MLLILTTAWQNNKWQSSELVGSLESRNLLPKWKLELGFEVHIVIGKAVPLVNRNEMLIEYSRAEELELLFSYWIHSEAVGQH